MVDEDHLRQEIAQNDNELGGRACLGRCLIMSLAFAMLVVLLLVVEDDHLQQGCDNNVQHDLVRASLGRGSLLLLVVVVEVLLVEDRAQLQRTCFVIT